MITPTMLKGYFVVLISALAAEGFGAEWMASILLGPGPISPYQMILPHCLAYLAIGIFATVVVPPFKMILAYLAIGTFATMVVLLFGIVWNYFFIT